jgi:hypothetical protein
MWEAAAAAAAAAAEFVFGDDETTKKRLKASDNGAYIQNRKVVLNDYSLNCKF